MNPLLLVRIAQGDAYAAAVEYIKFPRDQKLHDQALKFEGYLKHPTHALERGSYTDDTQMSIAVSEVLLEHDAYTEMQFIEAFVRAFKRDPRDGYSRGFQAFLQEVKDASDFHLRIQRDSTKNGAAMRSVPIGLLKDPMDVLEVADLQARVTHDSPEGRTSAKAVALMSHFAHHTDLILSTMASFCDCWMPSFSAYVGEKFNERVQQPDVARKTVAAAYHAIQTGSLVEAMQEIITWGGDTDTVGAIAWGILSARSTEVLPPFFDGGLENGPYGYNFLKGLGQKLMSKFDPSGRGA